MSTNLPELPRVNDKREADFGIAFRAWIEKNPQRTCTFEMKDSRGKNSILFSEITPEQLTFGRLVSSDKGVLIRLHPFIEGTPDYAYFRNEPAYIVIKFPKLFCLIPVGNLIFESKRSKKRSLTTSRAVDIATLVIHK